MTKQNKFNEAINNNNINLVKIMLNDSDINPTDCKNIAIRYAYNKSQHEVVDLLWNDQRVKKTLEIYDLKIFEKLTSKDIKNKKNKIKRF
jgi:hypothetical protein